MHAAPFVEQSTLDHINELRGAGYVMALDQFSNAPELEPLLPLVKFVKLDMLALGARELARHTFKLRAYELTLVAEKIENPEDFRLARAAGIDLFQGYFFCRPHLVGARAILARRP